MKNRFFALLLAVLLFLTACGRGAGTANADTPAPAATPAAPPIRRFAGDRLLVSVWDENGEDRPALIFAEDYRQSKPGYTWLELVYDATFLA